MSLVRYDCYCPNCQYHEVLKEKPQPQCLKCRTNIEIDVFRLHEWSTLQGKQVRIQPYVYQGHDFAGEVGTVVDTDPGEVIWIQMHSTFSILDETNNEIILDTPTAKNLGYVDARELFECITVEEK